MAEINVSIYSCRILVRFGTRTLKFTMSRFTRYLLWRVKNKVATKAEFISFDEIVHKYILALSFRLSPEN